MEGGHGAWGRPTTYACHGGVVVEQKAVVELSLGAMRSGCLETDRVWKGQRTRRSARSARLSLEQLLCVSRVVRGGLDSRLRPLLPVPDFKWHLPNRDFSEFMPAQAQSRSHRSC